MSPGPYPPPAPAPPPDFNRRAARSVACAALSGLLLFGSAVAGERLFIGTVVETPAGDLLVVRRGARTVPVRLAGIDAPGLDQPFGSLAQKHAEDLSRGQVVTVHTLGDDPRGRTVGVVVLPDGRDLGREMVTVGLARWDHRNAPEAAVLEELEEEARAAGRGMWRDPARAPP